jgi:hypothetical protein
MHELGCWGATGRNAELRVSFRCCSPAPLFHQVRKSSVTRLRELAEPRRRAALVCFLWQSYRDAIDQAVDMFDKLLTRAHTLARNELDEQLCRQRQTIQVWLTALMSLGRIILDDAISDEELRPASLIFCSRVRALLV